MMTYVVVFDASTEGYRGYMFLWPLLAFVVVGTGWILWQRRLARSARNWLRQFSPYIFTTIGVLSTAAVNVVSYRDYREMVQRLNAGKYTVVEGRVQQFDPMPWGGHKNETFVVDDHFYSYSDYQVTAGFNRTSSHGGPIRQGLHVRIADVDGVIGRLEVAFER